MTKTKNIQLQLGTIFWKSQCALYGVVAAATMFEAFTRKLPATFLLLSLEKSDDLSMDSQSQKSQAYNARRGKCAPATTRRPAGYRQLSATIVHTVIKLGMMAAIKLGLLRANEKKGHNHGLLHTL